MAIIPQRRLLGWNEIDELGDLERLRLVLEYMPDEELMVTLSMGKAIQEAHRGGEGKQPAG
ncbi:MAG: hypothetical protein AB1700_13085 [Bacillota bacterium]